MNTGAKQGYSMLDKTQAKTEIKLKQTLEKINTFVIYHQ